MFKRLTSRSSETSKNRLNIPVKLKQLSSTLLSNRPVFIVGVVVIVLGAVVALPKSQNSKQETQPLDVTVQPTSALEPSHPPVSLANGTNITPPQGSQGLGSLRVINGTTDDAVAKLVDSVSGKTYRFVYVRANHEVTITGISPCACTLKFSTGMDWDRKTHKFLLDQSFSQFIDLLQFRETRTGSGVKWAKYEVTLHPVPSGGAQTTSIDERDF